MSRGKELLHVKGLNLSLNVRGGSIKIVEGLDLKIREGEVVGLIGPTDAGKSVTAKALLGVLQPIGKGKPVWNIEGEVVYKGKDLFKMPEEEFRNLRGNEISMIFQKPRSSLHPILVIGDQTGEPVEAHEDVEKRRLREMVVNYLDMVELPEPKRRFNFPRDKFSGGEAQRIMIAMALICKPSLLIADEPTSDLDVIVQGQVLELLKRMKREFGLSMLLITHHLGVIAEMCDYVYVMYAGRIIEHGDVRTIFKEPKHPYTRGLLNSVPRIDADHFEMKEIRGDPPRPPYNIPGCMFHPRCEYVVDRCTENAPALEEVEPSHHVACHRSKEI